ncbi:pentapeptide repeat-containing protein, partial [Nodularia sp. UHCC 0506]|uniref:pentapeptide repeat-containing protein n=1 Tax=Nodularia sp. UHCC 0506 TaxID=3110243 RepID=UPI002B1F022E
EGYIEAAGAYPNSKTLKNRQAIVDRIKEEKVDAFLTAAIAAGLNPIGDFTGLNLRNIDFLTTEMINGDEDEYDLSNANLENTNLSLTNLRYMNLSNANLKNANLSGAELAILPGANLTDATLTDTYLGNADLTGANCLRADFSRAKFAEEYTTLEDCNFQYAKFIETQFHSETAIDGCDFSYADFSHAQEIVNLFGICEIEKGVNFSYANFSYTDLSGFEFNRMKLELKYAQFQHTELRGVNLSNLDLSYINFANANLENANLENCDLTGASLTGANLKGTNLKGVNFQKIGQCKNIKINLKTQIDEEWRMLVNEQSANTNYNLEEIIQQLTRLQNKPSWQLKYISNPDGTESAINDFHRNKSNFIEKIVQGHSVKLLIRFIGENHILSLSPQTVWVEEVPREHPNFPDDSTVIAQYQSICDQSFFPPSLRTFAGSCCQTLLILNTKGEFQVTRWRVEDNSLIDSVSMGVSVRWLID